MEFFKDLWGYVRTHKKMVFLPIIIVLILSAIFILIIGTPAITPFIYALF